MGYCNISDGLRDAAIRLGLRSDHYGREAEYKRKGAAYPGNGEAKWAVNAFTGQQGAPLTVRARLEDEADLLDAISAMFQQQAVAASQGHLLVGRLPSAEWGDVKEKHRAQAAWDACQGELPNIVGATLFREVMKHGQVVDRTPDRRDLPEDNRDNELWVAVRDADIRKRVQASKEPSRLGEVFEDMEGADRRFAIKGRSPSPSELEPAVDAPKARLSADQIMRAHTANRRISGGRS